MNQGMNSSGVRKHNEQIILAYLRKYGPASKSELARALNLTPQAITRIVDGLQRSGWVVREGRRLGALGQPPTLYSLRPGGAYSIGIKIGCHDMELLLMDFSGQVLQYHQRIYEQPDPGYILSQIGYLFPRTIDSLKSVNLKRLMGVGVAFTGSKEKWPHCLENNQEIFEQWQSVNFSKELTDLVSLPLVFEDEGVTSAIAELYLGLGRQASHFLYIYIGRFVGGGVILHGGLQRGSRVNLASIASMPVPPSKLPGSDTTEPGAYQLLNQRASLSSLYHYLNENNVIVQKIDDLSCAMDSVRPYLQDWMEDCADALVHCAMSSTCLIDLEVIVIDSSLPRFIVEELVAMVSRRTRALMPKNTFVPEMLPGQLGSSAAAIGGGILPFYYAFAADKTVLLKGSVPERRSS